MTEYAPRGSQDHNAFFPNSHLSLSQYSNDSGMNYVYNNGQIPYSTVNGSYSSCPTSYLPSHHDTQSMYLSMPNTMQYAVLPPARGHMPPPRSLNYPYHTSTASMHRPASGRARIGTDLNLNPMADIEDQTSYNEETMLSEPIIPPVAGYPDVNEFDELVRDYVGGLSPKKQDKALIHARRAANILAVLVDKKTTAVESAQFRFWVKKMFTLLPNDPSIPDRKKKICHEGKPVAVREKLFKILTRAHKACQHGGRDKTSAQVRRVYSWVPKELISRFVKLCPTCKVRRGQNRGTMHTPDKESPEDYDDCAETCSLGNSSRRESETTKRSSPEEGKISEGYHAAPSESSYLGQDSMEHSNIAPSSMAPSTSMVGRSDHSLAFASITGSGMYSPSGFPSSNLRSTNHWQRGPSAYDIKQQDRPHYDTDMKYQQASTLFLTTDALAFDHPVPSASSLRACQAFRRPDYLSYRDKSNGRADRDACRVVHRTLPTMNIFRVLADLSHLASIIILLHKMRVSGSCAGISFKSQALYFIVYVTRYLGAFQPEELRPSLCGGVVVVSSADSLPSPDIFSTFTDSAWNTIFKIIFLASSGYTLYVMLNDYKPTHDPNVDTFKVEYLLGGAAILAILFPIQYSLSEIFWAFSIWLESVAILPQLFMLQRTGEAETITTHYLFALGLYRALYIPNWVYRYFAEGWFEPRAVVAGLIQTILYSDFFWIYYTK
ncbi:hypothetical protein DV735_g2847, partial [Chaetothyriales sp. CBS 134920]